MMIANTFSQRISYLPAIRFIARGVKNLWACLHFTTRRILSRAPIPCIQWINGIRPRVAAVIGFASTSACFLHHFQLRTRKTEIKSGKSALNHCSNQWLSNIKLTFVPAEAANARPLSTLALQVSLPGRSWIIFLCDRSQMLLPGPPGAIRRIIFGRIRTYSRRVRTGNICECVNVTLWVA